MHTCICTVLHYILHLIWGLCNCLQSSNLFRHWRLLLGSWTLGKRWLCPCKSCCRTLSAHCPDDKNYCRFCCQLITACHCIMITDASQSSLSFLVKQWLVENSLSCSVIQLSQGSVALIPWIISMTRSLGALQAPTSSLRSGRVTHASVWIEDSVLAVGYCVSRG